MRSMAAKALATGVLTLASVSLQALPSHVFTNERPEAVTLDSRAVHGGKYQWKMLKASEAKSSPGQMSSAGFNDSQWMDAVVPGTVLTSLVYNKVYPDPHYGDNNRIGKGLIPDISKVGREFYTYWFRTEFNLPASMKGQTIWLQPDGINYRAEIYVNGYLVSSMAGMFRNDYIDISDFVKTGGKNAVAVLVHPVDITGKPGSKTWGAVGEFRNGGDGNIGWDVTQLMTVGWDFTWNDGVRDRNTGIWRGISLYSTRGVQLRHPFVKSSFDNGNYDLAHEQVSVELFNPRTNSGTYRVDGEILGTGIAFTKEVRLNRGELRELVFSPKEFKQLNISSPKLWWPKNKGPQNLYALRLRVSDKNGVCDSLTTMFGIRDIKVSRDTPDKSKVFIVNGKRIFVKGSNWLPDAMLRTDDARMEAELRYTSQSGINLLRLWGGGIAETDKFYELCDKYGLLVWQEFWLTGDTRHPHDYDLYFANMSSTVKRIRNHPSLVFYVSSNEGAEVSGARKLLADIDGTRPYQEQSEIDGIHDGSPYKQVNPMCHYENTASDRGSRIDGFNPEYGAPTLPVYASLKEMMPASDLWPINKAVWDYLDGNGFHLMTTLYDQMVRKYGEPASLEDYAVKGQLVGAMNSKSIWECWNDNKLQYGDRFCSGLLFWYHNCTMPQVCARMWDYSLEPTASLYHTMHSLEPIHVQYDYLKNTVSVVNDYLYRLDNYSVTATVYDINSKVVSTTTKKVSVPEDGVANDVVKLSFPDNISQVHFINLVLKDNSGKTVSENFYWRSKDKYEGRRTVTGPCTSGFESLANMPKTALAVKVKSSKSEGRKYISVTLKNNGKKIAFFNQLELLDANGSPVRPSFYSDNFFTLMPGRQKTVTIDVAESSLPKNAVLKVKGWNTGSEEMKVN